MQFKDKTLPISNQFLCLKNLKNQKFIPKITSVYIEISGNCNAKCPYCARQHFKNRYAGNYMSSVLFEQIIDRLLYLGLLKSSKTTTSTISLYNWGEPFLNPEINNILIILQKNNLFANVSSNFIKKPIIEKENFKILSEVTFSLSGFTQESYGKIHGSNLKKVLNHFEEFYKEILNYAPTTRIKIAWHRYTFNEQELWDAYKYFDRPGISFNPVVAYLNDISEMQNFVDGELSYQRKLNVEKDLFLSHISKKLTDHKSKHHDCFMWNYIAVDEIGQLLLCCGGTNNEQKYILGNILQMSIEEVWLKKIFNKTCKKCILSGIPHALGPIGYKTLPSGGKRIKYKLIYNLVFPNGFSRTVLSKIAIMVSHIPYGVNIIKQIKNKYA